MCSVLTLGNEPIFKQYSIRQNGDSERSEHGED